MNTPGFMVVPRRVGTTWAEVFAGGFGAGPEGPTILRLSSGADARTTRTVLPSAWTLLDGAKEPSIHCHTTELAGLTPGTSYHVSLQDASNHELASGTLETLPERLPPTGAGAGPHRPFTVWLSSCFHGANASPLLEPMVHRLLDDPHCRPHVKFLVGDQVYLDAPLPWTAFSTGEQSLRARFNRAYAQNWNHPGFRPLLTSTATFFLTDDHEFWNNYPDPPTPFLGLVRTRKFWDRWRDLALERARAIQGGSPLETFTIKSATSDKPAVSFLLLDTRIDRSCDGRHMVSDDSMERTVAWLSTLPCPGVLVVGQPVLASSGGTSDWRLPDYLQYRHQLLPALNACKHDVLVLAGDAHYGRLAQTRIGPGGAQRLVEVLSSPLSLVDALSGALPEKNLRAFPSSGPRADAQPVEYLREVPSSMGAKGQRLSEEHGFTISFWSTDDQGLGVRIRPWLVRAQPDAVPWTWETRLA